MVVLIPEKNVGFAITMNAEEGAVRRGLTYELLDHYLGRPMSIGRRATRPCITTMLTKAKAAVEAKGRGARQDRPVAVARPLRWALQGPLVRPDHGRQRQERPGDRLQRDAAA